MVVQLSSGVLSQLASQWALDRRGQVNSQNVHS